MQNRPPLAGLHILLVDDDRLSATVVRDVLERAGAVVIGPGGSFGEAVRLLEGTGVDAAVLEIHLAVGSTHTLAYLLKDRCIPFLFVTHHVQEAESNHPDVPTLEKPPNVDELVATIARLASARLR